MNPVFRLGLIPIAIIGLFAALGSFYSIDDGERGVIVTNGRVTGIAGPGINWKMPFFTTVHAVSLREHAVSYENLQAYTRDQQVATTERISVVYRIPEDAVREVYSSYGSVNAVVDQFIGRRVNEELEKVFGQYNAERAVQNRTEVSQAYGSALKQVEGPIQIVRVQLENFSFPDAYEQIINERMAAEVEALRAEQTAKKTLIDAQAAADAQLAAAKANAEAIRLRGDAEAAAIRARGEALRDNPMLPDLVKAERWDGVLPTTMLPDGALPFISAR